MSKFVPKPLSEIIPPKPQEKIVEEVKPVVAEPVKQIDQPKKKPGRPPKDPNHKKVLPDVKEPSKNIMENNKVLPDIKAPSKSKLKHENTAPSNPVQPPVSGHASNAENSRLATVKKLKAMADERKKM